LRVRAAYARGWAMTENQMQADGNSFPVFILGWTIGAIGVECDGMTSLSST
jgi:hypothetical protein